MAGASDGATFVIGVTTDNEGSGAMVPATIVVTATSLVGPDVVLSGARPVPDAPTATEPTVAPTTAATAIATARGNAARLTGADGTPRTTGRSSWREPDTSVRFAPQVRTAPSTPQRSRTAPARRSATDRAVSSSNASTITRTRGSVPLHRSSTRPRDPSVSSAALMSSAM